MNYFNLLTERALSSAFDFQVPEYGTAPSVNVHDTIFSILEMILGVFKYCFSFLKGIQFLGTNLLNFSITVLILAAVFPIIFSLVGSRFAYNVSAAERSANASSRRNHYKYDPTKKG